MILAVVDQDSRLKVYTVTFDGLQEIAAVKVEDTTPVALAAAAATLASMAGALNGDSPRKPRAIRSDKGKPRKPQKTSKPAGPPLGTGKLAALLVLADGAWWLSADLVGHLVGIMSREGLSASLSQWVTRGELEVRTLPPTTDRPRALKQWRITDKGRATLEALNAKLGDRETLGRGADN